MRPRLRLALLQPGPRDDGVAAPPELAGAPPEGPCSERGSVSKHFRESIRRLIVETSSNLAPDARRALMTALERESPRSRSALALRTIALDVDLAAEHRRPICQDTGERSSTAALKRLAAPVGA
jgi:Fumarate hydratase (Fumerase)